jgi:Arc/MetJ-type ribon-helix-helix transcriptional regulator
MTATTKLAISLPRPLAERTRRAVRKGRAASVSTYVAEALEEKTKMDDLAGLLDEMLAESGGPLTSSERSRASAALGLRAGRRRGAR